MARPRSVWLWLAVLVVQLLPCSAWAAKPCVDRLLMSRADLAQPPNTRPIEARVGIDLLDVRAIDGATESFVADLYFYLKWVDPRIEAVEGDVAEDKCRVPIDEVTERLWMPQAELINLMETTRRENAFVVFHEQGEVEISYRLVGRFHTPLSLSAFPFDLQTLRIEVEPFFSRRGLVVLGPSPDLATDQARRDTVADLNPVSWKVRGVRVEEQPQTVPGEGTYSRFVFELEVQRMVGFYVWKIVVPLVLITMLSWSVFWMSQDSFEGQMSVSVTCVLAVIAFNFVIIDDLPKIPYLTILDRFILVAYVFVFLGALENVVANVLHRDGRKQLCDRVEVLSRWLFPISYVFVNTLIVLLGTRGYS